MIQLTRKALANTTPCGYACASHILDYFLGETSLK